MKFTYVCVALFAAGISHVRAGVECGKEGKDDEMLYNSTPKKLEDITVPEGGYCIISTNVKKVEVKEGATLQILVQGKPITIDGDIKCDKCKSMTVMGDVGDGAAKVIVKGDIEAKEATEVVTIANTEVAGDIKIEECNLMDLMMTGNTVSSKSEVVLKKNKAEIVTIGIDLGAKVIHFEENDFGEVVLTA